MAACAGRGLRTSACGREDRRPADLLHRAQVYGDDYPERYFGPPDRLREGCARNRACDVCAGRERRAGGGATARVPGAGDAYAGRGMGRDGRGRLPAGCRCFAASFCGRRSDFRPRARGCPRSRRALPEGGDRRQDRHGRHPGYGTGDRPPDRPVGRCPRYRPQPHDRYGIRRDERRGAARPRTGTEDHVACPAARQTAARAPVATVRRGGGRHGRRYERRPGAEFRQRRAFDGFRDVGGQGCQ